MAALKIVACDNKRDNIISFRVYRDGDGDLRSCNVISEYIDNLVNDNEFRRGEPEEYEHPFYEVAVEITDTHKQNSKFGVTYQRLDCDPRYNGHVEKMHDQIYGSIKRSVRQSMNRYREEKRAKAEALKTGLPSEA